ncbi:MAG TPA: hypothetical protein VKB88_20185 [Bryobacteraceae bacterium]|nr:hypothetical protein [Bryobacteraceae bacterium]
MLYTRAKRPSVCTANYSLSDPNGARILNSANGRVVGAFPYATASTLVAGVADTPGAGEAAWANVHYQIVNKDTGKIDTNAVDELTITAFGAGGGIGGALWQVCAGADDAATPELLLGNSGGKTRTNQRSAQGGLERRLDR